MKIDNAKTREVSADLALKEKSHKRISLLQEKFREEISYLGIDQLVAFRFQAREQFDDESIISLAQTIKKHGIRQPLTVLSLDDGKFEIVSGERRYRAAKIAELTKIPCLIMHDKKQAEEVALIENVQRTDLTLIELGNALNGLIEREIFDNNTDMSESLGIPRTKVVECIALAKLKDDVKTLIQEKKINNRDVLRKIVALKNPSDQIKFVSSLNTEPLTNRPNLIKEHTKGQRSILRISLSDNEFIVQMNGVLKMNQTQKGEFRKLIVEILEQV